MSENVEVSPMRWADTHKVFDKETPILIFLVDRLDEEWNEIPEDMLAVLETLQSTSRSEVRVYEVDFRVEADFLNLFGTPAGACVVRRLPNEDTFDVLRMGAAAKGRSWVDLIEFCRPAYAFQPRFIATGAVRRSVSGASGEIMLTSA